MLVLLKMHVEPLSFIAFDVSDSSLVFGFEGVIGSNGRFGFGSIMGRTPWSCFTEKGRGRGKTMRKAWSK
jgi:hypothetical protein